MYLHLRNITREELKSYSSEWRIYYISLTDLGGYDVVLVKKEVR